MAVRHFSTQVRDLCSLLAGVAGWSVFYLALTGAAGFLVTRAHPADPGCTPFLGYLGLIQSSCRFQAVDHIWFGLLGIPRFLIVLASVAVASVRHFLVTGQGWADVARAVGAVFPLGLVLAIGVGHWARHPNKPARLLGWLAVAVIAADIWAVRSVM